MKLVDKQTIEYLFLKMSAHCNHFLPKTKIELDFMKSEYFRELEGIDEQLIFSNLKSHIHSSNYLPTIADLVKKPVSEYRIPVPSYEETKQRMLMLETKSEPIDADFMEKIKREGLKKIQEGRKTHERRVAKLFEQ